MRRRRRATARTCSRRTPRSGQLRELVAGEKLAVAAVHCGRGVTHEPDRSRAPGRSLPFPRWQRGDGSIKQCDCNRAVVRAGKMPVERAQHEDHAASPLWRNPQCSRPWTGGVAREPPEEPVRAFNTRAETSVKRNQNGEPSIRCRVEQRDSVIAVPISDDHVAISSVTPLAGDRAEIGKIDRTRLAEPIRRSGEDDGVRHELRLPQRSRAAQRMLRIAGERSAPIGCRAERRPFPHRPHPTQCGERYVHSLAGSRCCAGGIPTQGRNGRDGSVHHMLVETANPLPGACAFAPVRC